MAKTNYWSILVAAIAAFVFSSLYYSPLLLGGVWRTVDPVVTTAAKPSGAIAFVEFGRTLVITLVIARVLGMLQVADWKSAVRLAVLLWLGFSAAMWAGAIMWEKTPWPVAAIHSGDWLVKTVLIAFIVGVWHR
jgi:Protein of unknown function (DUF1761)